ncbi:MAG: glycoside hydrolase family 127 protein, partial [Candidatus Hydrogenedentes bacterium]|nr:glycoside hydrolase family 127 protein [Candidatus Hydrogenedentota bacterium]
RHGEALGPAYYLPNAEAYNETCAAIANILWNHRMFLLHGEAKYIDVLERTLYNGCLAGVSLEGDTFFYPNPLESDAVYGFNHGTATRAPWFRTSCCPVNIARFIPSLANYVYGQRDGDVFVNLFIGGEATLDINGTPVKILQNHRYPWEGEIEIVVEPAEIAEFTLNIRIPGWAQGQPIASDLYRYQDPSSEGFELAINDGPQNPELVNGYARLKRTWFKGDTVHLTLPMPVRRVLAHEKVEADRGRVAIERGPIVYCAEGVDNDGHVLNFVLPDNAELGPEHIPTLLDGVTVLKGHALKRQRNKAGEAVLEEAGITLIPYYGWSHRGIGEMQVWLARTEDVAHIAPIPTIASTSKPSTSHVNPGDTLSALNDQREPANSNDQNIPRFTWWDHKGTTEWVQYAFEEPRTISSVEVYWFDDTGTGQCRVPESWHVEYRQGDTWKPVENPSDYGVTKDSFNRVSFKSVETDALRLAVKLQPDFSGGILEWRVKE